jgi:hypothetical protein
LAIQLKAVEQMQLQIIQSDFHTQQVNADIAIKVVK